MTAGHPSRHVVLCLLALGGWAAPVVIWLLNSRGLTFGPAIPYGNNGHCDAWHYFGLATLGDSAWTIASNFRMQGVVGGKSFPSVSKRPGPRCARIGSSILARKKDRYDVTEAALVFVREFGISQLPVIWIDSDFDAHMMLSGYRSFVRCGFEPSFPAHLPDPKRHRQEPLAPGVLLVVLTSPQVTPSDVAQALRPHAMGLRESRDRVITRGESAIRVTVGKVVALEQE